LSRWTGAGAVLAGLPTTAAGLAAFLCAGLAFLALLPFLLPCFHLGNAEPFDKRPTQAGTGHQVDRAAG
jgi:hypothetical protein